MNPISVICPKCQHKISIDDALTHQIEETQRKKVEAEYNDKLLQEKKDLWKKAQEEAQKKISAQSEEELKGLKEEFERQKVDNERKEKQLAEFRENELKLREDRRKIEEEKENLKLQVQRQLDEEREKIREESAKRVLEEQRLVFAEKDKKIDDMQKMIEELKQKAQQGSQQLQGEVLELELENLLKVEFPVDEILPVPKGVNGADILQKVRDQNGRECGVIIWESKRTKNWTEGWIQKLKDDQRAAKADVAIIVSAILPDGVKNFETREGVYVASFDAFAGLAKLVRSSLIELQKTKLSTVDKNNKMEVLYTYLSGNEFRQRFEAIIEAFTGMRTDLEKEKQLYTKIWAKREKQIQKVVDNTIGMYGDLQGLMGASLPEIKSLAFEEIGLLSGEQD